MLPLNEITPSPIPAAFLFPYDEPSLRSERVYGGAAINDASQGREVRLWAIAYDGINVTVSPDGGVSQQTVRIPGVLTCSLGFDTNMNSAIAWLDATGAHLRYFDSYTLSYIVLDIPGATSCKARTDDTRSFNSAGSDVIFAYTLSGFLRYRAQRDHYAIEYQVGPCGSQLLNRVGMNAGGRFQFEVV